MKNSAIRFLYDTVRKYPDKVCVSDNREALSFGDLFSRASGLAEILRQGGGINQPILVYLPKGTGAVVSFAGILMSGNFYAPVDIKSPSKRIGAILDNLCPYRIVSTRQYGDALRELSVPDEKIVFLEDSEDKTSGQPLEALIATSREATGHIIDTDPCYVMHTSGSTGIPKGVVIPHRGVTDYIEWAIPCLGVDKHEIIGSQAPFYFDNSTLDIYLSWAAGATLDLIPDEMFLFPVRLIEYLEKQKITFVFFVPSVLVNISKMKLLGPDRLPALKKVIFAGEVMPAKHLACWQHNLPDKLYVNLYGPTEITVDCTYFIVERKYAPHESLPIGFPCHNSGILILNDADRPAGVGEQGELCVRGSSLALGYWNDPEKTDQVFMQNPLQEHYADRIYRTGDLVYRNERGEIIYLGRKDSQIKHMGNRIELGEIETAAMSIGCVDNCCVLYNEKKQEITLFYEGSGEVPVSDLRGALIRILPNYMVPRKVHYLPEKLPINPNSKIDRKALENVFL
ncbi:AMP-dependent synthetase [Desulfonema ishimotonii]|uniref:AMP-dependent synthetase n=1 Tax=Desulfonema ishimotonii TaxID=45657 RepID=A0A401G3S4_9BACT|nr:amino acid adenylation domain-containing protein [Desulfonema ishimotonii]GBC63765.1 AMP-dependent synthetase [Desulfonema ishimotonii]